ncbi:cutinase family protein [Desertihabitans brevis]|uniref:cutinase family protein n=1 Tax=Desertihabitans brevis TaxID=2268447 RepID=UPI00131404D9|nr:cutinase family protein [Desertihabitans brevis]
MNRLPPLLGCLLASLLLVPLVPLVPLAPASARTASWDGLDDAPHPSSAPAGECADLLFVGARGSGEVTPWGDTVEQARTALDDAVRRSPTSRPLTARTVWLDFPASDPHTLAEVGLEELALAEEPPTTTYFDSVTVGEQRLQQLLDDSAARCPRERWILVGFSQGAEVVTATLSRRTDGWRVAGAVLAGSPATYPGQAVRRHGTAPESATGLVATLGYVRAQVQEARRSGADGEGVSTMVRSLIQVAVDQTDPTAMASAAAGDDLDLPADVPVFSVCDSGDLVCDAGPALLRVSSGSTDFAEEFERTRPVHGGYGAEHFAPVFDAVLAELPPRLPPPEPVPTVPPVERPDAVAVVVATGALLLVLGAVGLTWWRRRRRPAPADDAAGRRGGAQ